MSELTPERLAELWQLACSPSSWIEREIPERETFLVLLREIKRLRQRVADLTAGLRPFAEYSTKLGPAWTGVERIRVTFCEPSEAMLSAPSVGDCRAAARLLAEGPE